MSTLRKTVTWMLLLAALGAAGGGAYVWRLWNDSHRIIRDQLEIALVEKVPSWDVSFEDVELDLSGTLTLTNVALRLREHEGSLVEVPQLVVALDRELLKNNVFRIQRVTLHEPSVWVNREASGSWNWQFLTPPPESDAPCPVIDIVHGTIVVHSVRTNQLPETSFSCRSVNGRFVPSGHRRYAVRIVTDVDHAGALAIVGSVDLKQKAFQLTGDIAALDTQRGALDVAAGLSPELRQQVTALSEQKTVGDWSAAPTGPAHPRPVTSTSSQVPLRVATAETPRSEFSLPELGVQAQLDVHFELNRAGATAPVEYSVAATIHEGQIVNPALPVPLYNLKGRIRATQQRVEIEDVSAAAANGESQLRISGSLDRKASSWSKDLTIKAVNIVLDPSVREYVHNDTWRRMYDQIQPAGRFNLDVRVAHDGGAKWDVTLNEFTAIECSLLHEQFQYPIHRITGSVWQPGGGRDFQIKLDGYAGDRPVHLEGQARNPGPELEATVHITATDIPLDRRVLDALALPKYEKVRRALELLQLQGLAKVDGTLRRAAGPNQKFSLALHVDVHDGELNYEQFPYRITQLSGTIDYDPALAPIWFFRKLKGVHVNSRGEGTPVVLTSRESSFDLRQPPGELVLDLTAENAAIDTDLMAACITASPSLRRIWTELTPSGDLDLDVDLRWRPGPGSKVDVQLPRVALSNGRMTLRGIPLEWSNVNGAFSWSKGTASIQSLYGEHGGTTLEIVTGPEVGAAYVEIEPQPNLDWHAHFDAIRIRGLQCDSELRGALPSGLAEVIKSLDPQGPLNTDLSIDLKGAAPPNDTVTASWSQRVHLPGNRITAGVVLDQASGLVEIVKGTWDGTAAVVEGFINLQAARALNMPLQSIRGPFTVDGNVVTIGTPDWRQQEWGLAAPVVHDPKNQFAGLDLRVDQFFHDEQHKGRLGVNAVAFVDPENAENSQYRAAVVVRDASLRAWARERKIRVDKLRGSINGRLTLQGRGSSGRTIVGDGFMKISDAELFDLPVFAAMMPMLNFKRTGNTLFNEGFADFRLQDGLVIYNAIDLTGDAFELVGQGNMQYTSDSRGALHLDFYSKANDQLLGGFGRLPIVSPLLFDNWIHVEVTGTTDNPKVRQLPGNPAETMRGLLQDIGKLQSQMMTPFSFPAQNFQPQGMRTRPPGR
jgi:hypothetical protein